ncbi:MAG TPA: DcaP family trimeric outer membrane transporter [Terriglobales bacterium]|nr:DcaP family trimeric outer membrane transporter [Terriglobales bacterium]
MRVHHSGVWIRVASAVLLTVAFSTTRMPAQSQNPPKPDLQQLKEKLAQLEQMMTEVKAEIGALEKPPSTATPATPKETTQADKKPSRESDRALELYGFVQLDSGYQFKQNDPDWFDVVRPTKLPAFKDEFAPDGKVFFSVRQTRFGVKTSNPTPLGDLKTTFEFELFGTGVDAGQTTFRLRHAYGELGQFGAGQTSSPFMDIDVFPNTLEYWGPNGMVFFRNLQFRWMPIRGASRLTIAVERPGASADGGVYSDRIELQGIKPKFDMPDISWQARMAREWGYLQLAGIVRKITWVDTNNDQFKLGDTAWGWGINVSSNLKFGKKDTGRVQVVYGEGIENYMNDAPIDIGVKNNPGNPVTPIKGVALPVLGVVAFLDHNWNQRFSSAMGYSMVNIDNSNAEKPSDYHQGHYAVANLLYYPVKNVMVGGEFQFGRRVNFSDGFNVNDYRLQFSLKYNYSKLMTY